MLVNTMLSINSFMPRGVLDSVVRIYVSFENNFGIKLKITRKMKESGQLNFKKNNTLQIFL